MADTILNVDPGFYRFYLEVQEAVGMQLEYETVKSNVWCIHHDHFDINIIYYSPPFDRRVTSDNSGKRRIHIDEDYWMNRSDLILSRIAALNGTAERIHARDTVIARIDKQMSLSFLEEHHLNVPLPGKYRYGLFLNGELMAAAVFSGGRRMRDKPDSYRSFELLRFCHKQGVHVVGALSKLINGFRKEFHPDDIMTYADKDWSDGKRYKKTGFAVVGETTPQLFWIAPTTWIRYAENNLPDFLSDKTEDDLKREGYIKIYNSGSLKLVKPFDR